jgi:Curli production assembly/transport component CsgG
MKALSVSLLICTFFIGTALVYSQPVKRTVILPQGGGAFADQEQRLVNDLTTSFVNSRALEIVERQLLDQVRGELSLEHDGSFNLSSVAHVGRLLGVPAIVLVRVDDYQSTQRNVKNGSKTTIYGDVTLKVTAQILSVETATIILEPTGSFEKENQELSQSDAGRRATRGPFGIPIPGRSPTTGPDPNIALGKLNDEAFESVEGQIAPKITSAIPLTANLGPPKKQAKVAGVKDGMTYLNAGSPAGLKVGDRFQITRMVSSGMLNPDPPHQPLMLKKKVCILTISDVEDTLSLGKCQGDLAQSGDLAVPLAK